MACGIIRRVVLQNEQIQKTANTSTATITAAIAAAATKTSNAATGKTTTVRRRPLSGAGTRGNWALKNEQQRDQKAASNVRETAAIKEKHAR